LFNEAKMLDVDTMSYEAIDALPDFLKEKMKSSEEYIGRLKHDDNMLNAGLECKFARLNNLEVGR
jgi:hypothetical protein